ncbi:unnamed protein product [Spirodela intermedia]|uniref:Uncharacterized protein n=1 Tax=Spirodela intermedia TaxID=51605 RepID=A0A7I8IRG2_SPIIN|nr:unnamed protein product [Spirodela intermedia]CAA6660443.1 unnamed protein product [Spirodela intermedia]
MMKYAILHTNGVLPLESPTSGSIPALRSSSRKQLLPVAATVNRLHGMPASSPTPVSPGRTPSRVRSWSSICLWKKTAIDA